MKLRLLFPLREALSSTNLISRAHDLADKGSNPDWLNFNIGLQTVKLTDPLERYYKLHMGYSGKITAEEVRGFMGTV